MISSLADDIYEVATSWLTRKDPIPKRWKEDMTPIRPMRSKDLQELGAAECSKLVSRMWRNTSRLKDLSNLLRELSSVIQAESVRAQSKYEIVSNMSSLVTLPKEIFARILDCAVNQDQDLTNTERWKRALTLSHVNQYFRNTALSYATLWCNISRNADFASLSLTRSKEVPLNVQLTIGYKKASADPKSYDLVFERLLPHVLSHSKRWGHLDLLFDRYSWTTRPKESKFIKHHPGVREAFRRADVGSLKSLRIRNTTPWEPEFFFTDSREFESWNAPNLRHVVAGHYFPLSPPLFSNVTTLDITMKLEMIYLADFVKDLAQMKTLENLSMELESSKPNTKSGQVDPTELPSITHLRIKTGRHDSNSADLLEYFFASMDFPHVIDLSVSLSDDAWAKSDKDNFADLRYRNEVPSIFQCASQFPRVERFTFEVEAFFGEPICFISTTVPFNIFPSLKHFTLSTNAHLLVSLQRRSSRMVRRSIETITLNVPSEEHIGTIARLVKQVLEKRESRSKFRELIVVDAGGVGQDSKREEKRTTRYKQDEALLWCEDRQFKGAD